MTENLNRLSRRDFLKATGLVGVAMAFLKYGNREAGALGNPKENGSLCGKNTAELGIGMPVKAEMIPMVNNVSMGVRARDKALDLSKKYFGLEGNDVSELSVQTLKITGTGKEKDGTTARRSEVSLPLVRGVDKSGEVKRLIIMVKNESGKLDIPDSSDMTGGKSEFIVMPVSRMQDRVNGNQAPAPINFVATDGVSASRIIGSGWGEWIVDLAFMKLPDGVNQFIPLKDSNSNPFLID